MIIKTKDMRNSTNIFLTNLSIADLLVILICAPTFIVEVISRPETWVLGPLLCKSKFYALNICLLIIILTGKITPFLELTVAHVSVITILAISFERYYAICEPLKAGYVCTKTRALLICVGTWIGASLLTR